MNWLYRFIASGFGSGYLPTMPGTWGTLVAVLACAFFSVNQEILIFLTGISFFVGWFCSHQLILSQSEEDEDADPSWIVMDEIAGYFLTVYLTSFFFGFLERGEDILVAKEVWIKYSILGICFCMFRLFDIWKPFPIRQIESHIATQRSLQAFGIMIDDLLAAFYASLLAVAVIRCLGMI